MKSTCPGCILLLPHDSGDGSKRPLQLKDFFSIICKICVITEAVVLIN